MPAVFGDHRLPPRFWIKVERQITPPGCWLWIGSMFRNGYGQFRHGDEVLAHRAAYTELVCLIPDGLVIDHLCRNRACVNPNHLRAVTPSENVLAGLLPYVNIDRAASKTHCAQGHEFTPENTRRSSKGSRVCRTCSRVWDRIKRQRAKAGDVRPVGRPKSA